ncbi:DUF2528 family protein [Pseudomonas citronellolis]|uniref:DUF2528 family protein n=1 Tax=Pseudomonas citronellolis TaxID=53408 RepID=UPI0023E4591D|nr:DUF2528 family protein [Pseudomonas citronellolis]MDF3931371.1 DUF2528 family protein [Pseudomonas citronellolis]
MAKLEQFTLSDTWKDWEITLEVDREILTKQLATDINDFWTGSEDRLLDADGDVVRAVVRSAARSLIYLMLEDGGAVSSSPFQAALWTKQLHDLEGWGGIVEGAPFGNCGIRLVRADVEVDLDLEFKGA